MPRKGQRLTSKQLAKHRARHKTQEYRDKVSAGRRSGIRYSHRQPSLTKKMCDIEAAWMGALFEGEGSVFVRGLYKTNKSRGIVGLAVSIGSTEVETIATCLRLTGTGGVHYRPPNTKGTVLSRKPVWVWYVGRINSAASFLRQVRPYLTGKRRRANKGLRLVRETKGK